MLPSSDCVIKNKQIAEESPHAHIRGPQLFVRHICAISKRVAGGFPRLFLVVRHGEVAHSVRCTGYNGRCRRHILCNELKSGIGARYHVFCGRSRANRNQSSGITFVDANTDSGGHASTAGEGQQTAVRGICRAVELQRCRFSCLWATGQGNPETRRCCCSARCSEAASTNGAEIDRLVHGCWGNRAGFIGYCTGKVDCAVSRLNCGSKGGACQQSHNKTFFTHDISFVYVNTVNRSRGKNHEERKALTTANK
ncbi:hypothetical protein SRM1_02226 [Pseudomonas fluorescens]|nr:hypothetical protein SRM1_02226 [Pseudomonas fluorescens]